MTDVYTIGILGGMGPEATNRLCSLITAAASPVHRDQDHIPVITFNNSSIPDRVRAVQGRIHQAMLKSFENPVPEMIRTARVLEQAGADFLIMPCNLAHYFIAEIQEAIRIPILNMVEETVRHTVSLYPQADKIGLLASTPTISAGIFERAFKSYERLVLSPDENEQEAKVMRAIYGSDGVKCGHSEKPRALLMEAAQQLKAQGAEVIIAGCTEVSLVMTQKDLSLPIVDPLQIIAGVAVKRARGIL
jgi:aspartate racemase